MRSKVNLICVDPAQNKEFWPYVEPLLRSAVQNVGLSDFRAIATDILNGGALVWIAWSGEIEAAASTVLQSVGAHRICVLTACGGSDMKRWVSLLKKIEDYAKAEGCTALRIYGRKGWLRVLEDYREKAIVIEKEL